MPPRRKNDVETTPSPDPRQARIGNFSRSTDGESTTQGGHLQGGARRPQAPLPIGFCPAVLPRRIGAGRRHHPAAQRECSRGPRGGDAVSPPCVPEAGIDGRTVRRRSTEARGPEAAAAHLHRRPPRAPGGRDRLPNSLGAKQRSKPESRRRHRRRAGTPAGRRSAGTEQTAPAGAATSSRRAKIRPAREQSTDADGPRRRRHTRAHSSRATARTHAGGGNSKPASGGSRGRGGGGRCRGSRLHGGSRARKQIPPPPAAGGLCPATYAGGGEGGRRRKRWRRRLSRVSARVASQGDDAGAFFESCSILSFLSSQRYSFYKT